MPPSPRGSESPASPVGCPSRGGRRSPAARPCSCSAPRARSASSRCRPPGCSVQPVSSRPVAAPPGSIAPPSTVPTRRSVSTSPPTSRRPSRRRSTVRPELRLRPAMGRAGSGRDPGCCAACHDRQPRPVGGRHGRACVSRRALQEPVDPRPHELRRACRRACGALPAAREPCDRRRDPARRGTGTTRRRRRRVAPSGGGSRNEARRRAVKEENGWSPCTLGLRMLFLVYSRDAPGTRSAARRRRSARGALVVTLDGFRRRADRSRADSGSRSSDADGEPSTFSTCRARPPRSSSPSSSRTIARACTASIGSGPFEDLLGRTMWEFAGEADRASLPRHRALGSRSGARPSRRARRRRRRSGRSSANA